MRIALTHNLRIANSEDEAEFDTRETIAAIAGALERAGHRVEPFDVTGPASLLVTRLEAFAPDLAFNLAEGHRGKTRRAFYPALFPSTGSDAYTLCVTLDKALTKKQLAGWGIPSPQGRLLTAPARRTGGLDELLFPVIVKPNFEGSSKGIGPDSVAEDPVALDRVLERVLAAYPDGALVERYVPGVDVRMVRVEGLPALPAVETIIDPAYPRAHDVVDYRLANVETGMLRRRAPADLQPAVRERLLDLADRAFTALGLRDVAALDFRVGRDGEVLFLSATAIPSLAPEGALFAATRAVGFDFDDTVLAVLRAAATRRGLAPLLDAARPRPARARRASLRVGLAFNMKRIDSNGGDDREAEYDAPETIDALSAAIESHGHAVVRLEATPDFPRALLAANVDVVFNVAEGMAGRSREAQVPSLCELLGVPYTGSDSATLSICLDKSLAKRLLTDVDTPAFQALVTGRERLRPLRYPVIVKPNQEGTSKGISDKSVCDDEAEVRRVARDLIDRYGQPALVEEYIFGRELTVGLLGERRPRVLSPMEIVFLSQSERPVYDYQCKQDWPSHVRYECPAKLTKDELRAVERMWMDYRTLIGEILSGGVKRWQARQAQTVAAATDSRDADPVS